MKRTARLVAIVYFVTMAVAVTYPGMVPFNTIRPYVLGMPFALVWVLAWVLGATPICYFVHRTADR